MNKITGFKGHIEDIKELLKQDIKLCKDVSIQLKTNKEAANGK